MPVRVRPRAPCRLPDTFAAVRESQENLAIRPLSRPVRSAAVRMQPNAGASDFPFYMDLLARRRTKLLATLTDTKLKALRPRATLGPAPCQGLCGKRARRGPFRRAASDFQVPGTCLVSRKDPSIVPAPIGATRHCASPSWCSHASLSRPVSWRDPSGMAGA